jgi:hypothetical protein
MAAVENRSEIVVPNWDRFTGVDGHPQRWCVRPAFKLDAERGGESAVRRSEHRQEAIAGTFDYRSAHVGNMGASQILEPRHRGAHELGLSLPASRGTLYIGEQKGKVSARKLSLV